MRLALKLKTLLNMKAKPKSTEEQIEDLVNELILMLKADGKSIGRPDVSEGFGTLDINVHRLGEEDAIMKISSGYGVEDWKIEVKPHFNKF